MNKTYHPATVIKADELPAEVVKAAEGKNIDKWYYATVEANEDREGDVIRVKGLDPRGFKKNGGPVPVLVQHRNSPDANSRLPIVGGVSEWVATTHKATGFPALAAGIKFVDTDLGREMKTLADADLLDVSVGLMADDAPLRRSNGGRDFTKASIAELSVCVHGMNQYAGVVRALDAAEPAKPDNSEVISLLKSLSLRLDDVTCAVEALASKDEEQIKGHATTPPAQTATVHADTVNAIKALAARL